jgi:broad specificity phosphatase PhoE
VNVRRLEKVSDLVSKGKAPAVVLVRHGSTELNGGKHGESAERIRGWADIPLDEEGRQEAEKIAERMANDPIDLIYSSDLARALDTAKAIAAKHSGLKVHPTINLRPWHLGQFTKQPVADVLEDVKRLTVNENEKVPGGEAFRSFRLRCLGFLRQITLQAQNKGLFIVAVTHTRVTQLASGWVANGSPDDLTIDDDVMNDYKDEVHTGRDLVMKPSGGKVTLGTPE